jgi:hypothetical protein
LNTGIFSFSETTYIFWCAQVVSCRRAVWLMWRAGLKPQHISHQEKDGYLFSPTSTSAVAAQWQRSGSGSGSAVDAGVKTTLLYYWLVPFLSGER